MMLKIQSATPIVPSVRRLISIDPSTRALGYAVFEESRTSRLGARLVTSGAMIERAEDDDDSPAWLRNLDSMVKRVSVVRAKYGCVVGVIEQPEVFASARGSAAQSSGSIIKLVACAFSIRQRLLEAGVDVLMVPVRRWKGQVPKDVTMRRVRTHWAWQGTDHNESDAVGIGDWYIRKGPGLTST